MTRTIAFTIDAFAINLVGLAGVVVVASIALVLHLTDPVRVILGVIGGGVFFVWTVGYFVAFWCTTGQTPGGRMMRFRVVGANGAKIGPGRGLVRYAGMLVCVLLLGLGFVPIAFDRRRRGLHDRLAGTIVVDTPEIGEGELEPTRANDL